MGIQDARPPGLRETSATNPLRQLLWRAGSQPLLGTWLLAASPLLDEAVGHAGFDFGSVDMALAPLDLAEVMHLLQAIAGPRMMPLLRVPWRDSVPIKRRIAVVVRAETQTALDALPAIKAVRSGEGVGPIALRHGSGQRYDDFD